MPRLVDAIRMKSGSTDITIATTDGLFGGAASLPSTVAHTLVSTTDIQTVYNKTLSNETKLMTPTTANFVPLSVITWPSTVAHTLVATTGAQTIYDKTLADNVKLITASTANPIPLSVITWPSTAAHTLTATTVAQTLENKTFSVGVGQSILATATTSANVLNYGIQSVNSPAAGGGKNNYTLDPPAVGVEKVIWAAGAANSSDYANIYTGSTAIFFESAGRLSDLFIGLQQDRASVRLVGRTTAYWLVLGTHGTVAFSTA